MKKQMSGSITLDINDYNELIRRVDKLESAITVTLDYRGEPEVTIHTAGIYELVKEIDAPGYTLKTLAQVKAYSGYSTLYVSNFFNKVETADE